MPFYEEPEFLAAGIAAVAACASAFVSLRGVMAATRAQRDIAALNVYIDSRLKAYTELELALESWSAEQTKETYSAVYRAINVAALLASDETWGPLSAVDRHISDCERSDGTMDRGAFARDRHALLQAMRRDLQTVQMPEIRESPGSKAQKE